MKKVLLISLLVAFALVAFAQSEFMIPMSASDFNLRGPVKTVKIVYPEDEFYMEEDFAFPSYEMLTFDRSGRLLSQISSDKEGNEISAILFNYDASGMLASITGRENGVEESVEQITIENGRIVSIIVEDGEGESTLIMEYDEFGRLIAQKISGISEGEEIEMTISMAYDERGNLVEEGFGMMGMDLSRTFYEYNEKNQRIRESEFMYMFAMPGEDVEPIVSTLEYNEMGDVSIKISDSYWGDEKEAVVYEYEYDSMGNYISMVAYYVMNIADLETDSWKEMAMIEQEETREIEYY